MKMVNEVVMLRVWVAVALFGDGGPLLGIFLDGVWTACMAHVLSEWLV